MIRKLFYASFFLLATAAVISCGRTGKKERAVDLPRIEFSFTDGKIKMSDLVDSLSYIPLATDTSCLIGQVDKLIPTDSFLLVVDKETARAIYLFAKGGSFIRKIGSHGPGPEEFVSIEDVTVDEQGQRIIVLDAESQHILVYSFDGSFIKSYRTDGYIYNIAYVGNNTLACYLNYGVNEPLEEKGFIPTAAIFDLDKGKFVDLDVYADKDIKMGSMNSMMFPFSSDGLITDFMLPLNDTLYGVSSEGFYPEYLLDFGDGHRRAQQEYLDYIKNAQPGAMLIDTKVREYGLSDMIHFAVSGDILFVLYTNYERPRIGIANLKSGKSLSGKMDKTGYLENDMDGATFFVPVAFRNNEAYCGIEVSNLKEIPSEKLNPATLELQKNGREEDNPIIVVAKLKDF